MPETLNGPTLLISDDSLILEKFEFEEQTTDFLAWTEGSQSFNKKKKFRNILDLTFQIEKEKGAFNRIYLEWVHRIGNAQMSNGKSVKSILKLNPRGFSYWWSSYISQKSAINSSSYFLSLYKILALESILDSTEYSNLVYFGNDATLAKCIGGLAENKKVNFFSTTPHSIRPTQSISSTIRGLTWLATKALRRWMLAPKISASKEESKNSALVFSYFPNFDKNLAKNGVFQSNYWGEFNNWIRTQKTTKIKWILLYGGGGMTYKDSIAKASIFERACTNRFFFLESFLKLSDLFCVAIDFMRLRRSAEIAWREIAQMGFFKISNANIDISNLVKPLWTKSFNSEITVSNILRDRALRTVATIYTEAKWAIYPLENEPWEKLLSFHWNNSKGPLHGYQHTTFRPSQLSYFEHPSTYTVKSAERLPLPDYIICSSPQYKQALTKQNFPANKIKTGEAVRFPHIIEHAAEHVNPTIDPEKGSLLIAGDINEEASSKMCDAILCLLTQEKLLISKYTSIVIKPHPFCPLDKALKKWKHELDFTISNDRIEDSIRSATHVVSSADTSVALESYLFGRNTGVYVNLDILNTSPMENNSDVSIIHNNQTISEFLHSAPNSTTRENRYLYSGPRLNEILNA